MTRVGRIAIGRVSLKDGSFTYGTRIALGGIFADASMSEYRRLAAAFRELYGYSPRLVPPRLRHRLLKGIAEDFKAWVDREQQLLAYDPTPEEERAGIKELARKVGDFSTVKALGKAFGKDPDEVLRWEYSKVFSILFTDLEEQKYERRLSKAQNAKR